MRGALLGAVVLLIVSCGGAQRLPVDAAVGAGGAAGPGSGEAGHAGGGAGAGGAVSDAGGGGGDGRGADGEGRDADGGDRDSAGDASAIDADGPPPITEDEFCGLKAAQECQVAQRCVTVMSACVAQRKVLCLEAGARAHSGSRRFRPEATAACIDKTAAVYAKPVITPADLADMNDTCAYVYQGDVALLGVCTTKYDCASRALLCDKGFCATLMVKAVGVSCGNPGEICAPGAYCGQNAAGVFVCAARGNVGAACDATTPCLEALRCATTCESRRAAAQSCGSNDDCAAAAPFCDPYASNVCTTGLTFAAGAPSCAAYGGVAADAALGPG